MLSTVISVIYKLFIQILDIDECSKETSPCDQNADCTNSDGSYSCTCKQRFAGNGTACEGRKERNTLHDNLNLTSANNLPWRRKRSRLKMTQTDPIFFGIRY